MLGPTLWNLLYDDIMRVEVPEGTEVVCYADDLALLVTAPDKKTLIEKTNISLRIVKAWLSDNKLQVADEKTQATILLKANRNIEDVTFQMGNCQIKPTKSVKYLGMVIDQALRYREHLKAVTTKAKKLTQALLALMPNIKGPGASKRKTIATSCLSVIMYAAPIWSEAVKVGRNRSLVITAERQINLRICSGYRTISSEALSVITGTIPAHLLAGERERIYRRREGANREQEREVTMEQWQQSWQATTKARWTRRLIKDLIGWTKREWGQVAYHLTQLLSGHGCFRAQLKRFNCCTSDQCYYCQERDDVEHTVFKCPRWVRYRSELVQQLGEVTPENIVAMMLSSKMGWRMVEDFARKVITEKEIEERER